MKPLITLALLCLSIPCFSQSKQILMIGKGEADVLFDMKHDSTFVYDKQTFESDSTYHITYGSKNKIGLCNFYFEKNICILVVFYMPIEKLPDMISELNQYYKRTDNITWVEKTLHYKVVLHTEDKDAFEFSIFFREYTPSPTKPNYHSNS